MPTLDRSTVSGSVNSQAESWNRRPVLLRTAATTAVTMDTIPVPTGQSARLDCLVVGRQTSGNLTDAERATGMAVNPSGSVSVTAITMRNAGGGPGVWSSAASGAAFLSFGNSSGNVTVVLKPNSANQTDWQLFTKVSLV